MFTALSNWIDRRRTIARARAEFYALADELQQLEEHIAADPGIRDTLAAHVEECRYRMEAAARVAFPDGSASESRPGTVDSVRHR